MNLYDYKSKERYSNGLTYFKNRVTTKQKHTIDSQKPNRREHKHNMEENDQTTKGKTKRERKKQEKIQNQLENKVENGNKYIYVNGWNFKCQCTKCLSKSLQYAAYKNPI